MKQNQRHTSVIWQYLLVLFTISSTSRSSETVYYVTPTPDTPCPGEPCHTLSQYADVYFNNFVSNTTLVFLPGDHTLNHTISMGTTMHLTDWGSNVSYQPDYYYPHPTLTLLGSPSSLPEVTSRIVCIWPADFGFMGIDKLIISALAFISCGHYEGAAVSILSVQNSSISNCTFQNNTNSLGYGGAIYAHRSTLTLIRNTFQSNSASKAGGALYLVQDCILTLTESVFQSNSAGEAGGALYLVQDCILTLTESVFQNNSAGRAGGALYLHQDCILTLTESVFQNNSAGEAGGALYLVQDCILTLTESVFQNNSAGRAGGALYLVQDCILTLTESVFQNNSAGRAGGALYLHQDCILTLTESVFQNNSAGRAGGALYLSQDCILTLTESVFQNNTGIAFGGAIHVHRNNILVVTGNIFQNNLADSAGGIYAYYDNTLSLKMNKLQNNLAVHGGALYINTNNNLTLTANIFQNNLAAGDCAGALLVYQNNTLTLTNNTFQNNLANFTGGALLIHAANSLTFTMNRFQNNSASAGGAIFVFADDTVTLTNNIFFNNSALYGGALSVHLNTILIFTGNLFLNNIADDVGGVLYTYQSTIKFTNNIFITNTAKLMGGTIFCISNSSLSIHGRNRFWNNTAQYGGGVAAIDCQLVLTGNTSFENNKAIYGGGLYGDGLHVRGYADFINNLALKDGGGAYASRSVFTFEQGSNFRILGNSALNNGGGMLLTGDSKLHFQPNSGISFTSNHAMQKGGALMIEESKSFSSCAELSCDYLTGSDCFFQIQTQSIYDISTPISNITEAHNVSIYFENNSALEAGGTLYGGFIDNCSLQVFNQHRQYNRRQKFLRFSPYFCLNISQVFDYITGYKSLNISSDPLYICTCSDGETDCSTSTISMSVYPGGSIDIPVIAYGQRNGTTPAVIHNITPKSKITFKDIENTQNTATKCTLLKYTVKTKAVDTSQEVSLYAEGPCPPRERKISSVPTNVLSVQLKILQCPPGFELSEIPPACICAQRLKPFTNECQIDDRTIECAHDINFWVGYIATDDAKGLILHPHCPFDYCSSNSLYIRVDDSDKQCANNRSGLLCGKCSQNFSLALGSTRCLQCSNNYLWLLVAFAVAGLTLVFLVLVLNLTVAAGTINGLVFYANVLAVNSATFFQPKTTNILTVFIAWLNLDLGIETCFYDGMDTYAKTWLQFVFPLYVWALVIGIITVSHYSIRISTILGNSTVAVLATLILLSYAKLLRTVIAVLTYTLLEYPNNSQVAVWLYDGNIRYLSTKHIPLFIAAVACLIFLFLPYTLILLFGQWIQKSRWRLLSSLNNYRIHFFREAYNAPYTDKHRYWTGLMLLVRCALFFVFAFNTLGDPSINLLCIISASTALLILNSLLGNRIYKTWSLNVLELSFNSNLCSLAAATQYIRSAGGNQNAVTFTSISVAFVTFAGIVIYHLVHQLKEAPRWWRRIRPSRRDNYNPVPQTAADSVPQGRALQSPVDPSRAQFASVTYININELVREQLQEL